MKPIKLTQLSENVILLWKVHGLNPTKLMHVTGYSRSAASMMLSRRRNVPPSAAKRIAAMFGIDVGVLTYDSLDSELLIGSAAMLPAPARDPAGASARVPDETPEPPPPTAQTWTEIASWRGAGMKQTEGFTTTAREWRIQWQTTNEAFPGAGLLQVYVHDGSGQMLNLAANVQGIRSDVSYVRTPPGEHYLQISSANIDYAIVVEERR